MKTFIADIIPRIQKYSQKLDNLNLLTNQHWVVVDEIANSKTVYIFRSNQELLISKNGEVEKAKWEYLGKNSLLLDLKDKSYLFRHGFFDENVLALKVDGREEYALMVNETKYDVELNSSDKVFEFLQQYYLSIIEPPRLPETSVPINTTKYKTDKGEIEIKLLSDFCPVSGDKAFIDGKPAPDGKYKLGFSRYVYIKDGNIERVTFL